MNCRKRENLYLSWIGGFTFLSGAVNVCAITLLGFTISHYTGNISKAALALFSSDMPGFGRLISFVVLFFIGSMVSGFLLHDDKPAFSRYYALLPIMFGAALLISVNLTENKVAVLQIFALIMGAQNGMRGKFRGIPVRTTHMTGYLTDAGACLGAALRGHPEEFTGLRFYLLSILTFFGGGVVSGYLSARRGLGALEIIALLYILFGIYIAIGFAVGINKEAAPDEDALQIFEEIK